MPVLPYKITFLSNTDNASVALRKLRLESCNLHTVLDCPGGTFTGAGVKTVVLFFEKGAPTRKVWFYQLDPGRNMGKTNPLNDILPRVMISEMAKPQRQGPISERSGAWRGNEKADVRRAGSIHSRIIRIPRAGRPGGASLPSSQGDE